MTKFEIQFLKRQNPLKTGWILLTFSLLGLILGSCGGVSPAVEQRLVKTSPGQIQVIDLPDGSKVTLNQNTELKYPSAFDKDARKVEMIGEAYFEVVADTAKPFIITTHSCDVRVLGTEFSIKDYRESPSLTSTVKSGQIKIHPKGKSTDLVVEAQEKGIYQKSFHKLFKQKDLRMNDLAWLTKRLVYDGQPLGEVIGDLFTLYGAQIFLENGTLMQCPFTGTFDQQEISKIIQQLSQKFGMEAEIIRGTSYRLKGGKCEEVKE